jgi:hypothetical protein
MKTVEEQLRKVVESHQKVLNAWVLVFLLACKTSTHDTTALTPASLEFGRKLRLPCDLLFGVRPDKERPTIDHAAYLMDHLHDIQNYARQHLKLVSDRIKTRYDRLANCAAYDVGDKVWLYRPTRTKRKSPKLQSSCEGPYKVVNRINDVVYRIQRNPRSRLMVVHLDQLVPYQGATQGEWPYGGSSRSVWWVITVKTVTREGRWDQAQTTQA